MLNIPAEKATDADMKAASENWVAGSTAFRHLADAYMRYRIDSPNPVSPMLLPEVISEFISELSHEESSLILVAALVHFWSSTKYSAELRSALKESGIIVPGSVVTGEGAPI